ILTVQFSNSSSFDGVVSDPFMMIIPPFQQYLDSYTFATPVEGFTGHFFTSAVASDGVDGMQLNGAPLNSASFAPIGSTGFSAAAFPISTNTSYNLNNTEGYPSGLYVYGFGDFNSYGFPGGLSLLSINPGSGPTIELTSTVIGELFCTSVSQSVDIEITALITDPDEPFVQSATLFYRTVGEMNYTSVPMIPGAGDEWSAVVLATATQFPGLEFYIFATDGQISVTSPSVDPVNNPYVIAIENIPPQIVHVPIVNSPVGVDIMVSADVTDNTASVAGVELFYRISGGTPLYTLLNMGNLGGDTYQATIPGVQMTLQGIEYYIKATDNFGVSCFVGLPDNPFFITPGVAENLPPVPVGFPAVAPSIFVGDTYNLTIQFQSPEAGQSTDVVVNDGGLVGFSAVVISGNVASVDIELVGQVGNLGTHTIEFIATDNGTPALSTTVQFLISVLDPLAGQVICIPQGWSGISSYNDPVTPAMEDIFASLVADNKVVIVLGDNGFYWPAQNINTLTSGWDVKKGYKIKMNEPACLGIVGDMPSDKSFSAKKGASFIPVLCDQPVPAVDIFSQFGSDLLFAFDIYAQLVYWPQGGLYTLETLEPGVGYLVNMLNQGQASYSCTKSAVANFAKAQPKVFADAPWSYTKTDVMHFISISQSALSDLSKGDFVGVFNADGVCTGLAQYTGEDGNMLLVVYGNDVTTQTLDGMTENQEMTFKIYRATEQVELPLEVTFDASMPNRGSFSDLGQSMITKMSVVLTSVFESKLDKIYLHPNPGNGVFNMEIPTDDQTLQIQVMNVSGQVIYSSLIDTRINSSYRLDLSNQAQGVYFVKMSDLNETVVKKVVIQ
ncbi:MAG: T9SS type A sorting domain-containing protein, partial [Bacteroidales bacterium]|nr:T9SS type A sorting domain-containing protein [Bacteroidales bacterium]